MAVSILVYEAGDVKLLDKGRILLPLLLGNKSRPSITREKKYDAEPDLIFR